MTLESEASVWTRPLSTWVDTVLYGLLFAIGWAALAFFIVYGLASEDVGLSEPLRYAIIALVAIGWGSVYVWFFGPVYGLFEQRVQASDLEGVDGKRIARVKRLAVGNTLAWLTVSAGGTAPVWGMGAMQSWEAGLLPQGLVYSFLLVSPILAAFVVQVWRMGPALPLATMLWSERLGRPPEPGVAPQSRHRAVRLYAIALILLVYGVLVLPAIALGVVKGQRQVDKWGHYRLVEGGSTVSLTGRVAATFPDNWEGCLSWQDPFYEGMGISRYAWMKSPDEMMHLTFSVPNGQAVPLAGNPDTFVKNADKHGERLVGPESVEHDGWIGTAAWLTAEPRDSLPGGLLLFARLENGAGDTVYVEAGIDTGSDLDGLAGPAELTEAIIDLVDLHTTGD